MFRAQASHCVFHATDPADPSVRVTVKVQSILMLSSDIITERLGGRSAFSRPRCPGIQGGPHGSRGTVLISLAGRLNLLRDGQRPMSNEISSRDIECYENLREVGKVRSACSCPENCGLEIPIFQ